MNAPKMWATSGFMLGIGASVAGNVAHARDEVGAQLAAAFYPVALLVTVEVLARTVWPSGRSWLMVRFGGAGLVALVAAIVSYSHLHGLLVSYGEQEATAYLGPLSVDGLMIVSGFALLALGRSVEPQGVAEVPARGLTLVDEPPVPAVPEHADEAHLRAAQVFADDVTAGRVPGIRAIKQTLGIGQPKAKQVQAYLSVLANQ